MPKVHYFTQGAITLYTLEEAAIELCVSPRTAWQYIKNDRIPAVKIKGKWYIWEKNLIAFITGAKSSRDRHKVEPPEFATVEFTQYKTNESQIKPRKH